MASAMGLRQVLPVQTKRMITPDMRLRVDASIAPSSDDGPALVFNPNLRARRSQVGRPRVDDHVQFGEIPERKCRGRLRFPHGRRGNLQDQRGGHELEHRSYERVGRASQRNSSLGRDELPSLVRADG